jgi:diguanylate cyclase (GGDEF)-like protein
MTIERNSLLFDITVAVIMVTGVFFFFFYEDLKLTKSTMEKMERTKVEATIQSSVPNIADALYFGFSKPIAEIADMLLKQNSDMVAISIQTNQGQEYLYSRNHQNPFIHKDNNLVYKRFPIEKDGEVIGYIDIAYHLALTELYFKNYRQSVLLFALFIIFAIVGLLVYLYRKIKALNVLALRLNYVDPKRKEPIASPDNYYEINHITSAVNRLLERIREYAGSLKKMNKELLENKKRLIDAQRIAQMASWTYWPETKQLDVSLEFYRLFELDAKKRSIDVDYILCAIHPDDKKRFLAIMQEAIDKGGRFDFVHKIITSRGKVKHFHTEGRVRKSKNAPIEVMGISMDVTEEMEAKQQAEHMAFHDPLTNLLNRRAFLDRIEYLTKMAKRHEQSFALLFLDLDNFKLINDSYGHSAGDELLIETSKILKESIRKTDLIARIGGDEFVVVLTDITDERSVEHVGKKLLSAVTSKFADNYRSCMVTASLGIALFPKDAQDPETLLQYADAAMYEAKKLGKNRYQFFSSSIRLRLNEHLQTIEEVKEALKKEDEIRLYFQPQIDLSTGKVRGAEVLTRWMHPKKGLLFPNSYIPMIEANTLMAEYDRYVLRMAFKQLHKWYTEKRARWTLGINLSAHQFKDETLIDNLKSLLKEYPVDPSLIELEIMETLQMEDVDTSIKMLEEIKSLGFKISIDDFGTGYSSLSYLKRLPFDVIKIDREFIKDLHQENDDVVIVKLMIQIAKTLEKEVVAEGPDTHQHITILEDLSCDYAQGFYYSRAIDAEAFERFAESRS